MFLACLGCFMNKKGKAFEKSAKDNRNISKNYFVYS